MFFNSVGSHEWLKCACNVSLWIEAWQRCEQWHLIRSLSSINEFSECVHVNLYMRMKCVRVAMPVGLVFETAAGLPVPRSQLFSLGEQRALALAVNEILPVCMQYNWINCTVCWMSPHSIGFY